MAYNTLPSDIIDLIISYAISDPVYDLFDWKEQLNLLAVNSQWRSLAKPYVFKHIFLSTAAAFDDNEDDEDDRASEQDAGLEFQSNIALIMAAQALQTVQVLDIRIEGSGGISTYIKGAIEMLFSHAKIWPNLNFLYINIMLDELDSTNHEENIAVADFTLTYLCEEIESALPNIKHIEALGSSASTSCTLFMSKLVDIYASKLEYLDCSFPLALMSSMSSGKMKHLSMEFDEASEIQLPDIITKRLEYLSLRNLTGNTIWQSLRKNAKGGSIVFDDLQQMSISYNPTLEKNIDYSKEAKTASIFKSMQFPVLKNISITLGPHIAGIIELASFPDYIEKLQIQCPMGGVATFTNAKFDRLTRKTIANHILSGHIHSSFSITPNFLFSLNSFAEHASFYIDSISSIPNDDFISWVTLSELIIDSKVHSTKLLTMLTSLPNLTVLRANYVEVDDDTLFPDISTISLINHGISGKLKHLSLWFDSFQVPERNASAFIQTLVARSPLLEVLEIPNGQYGLKELAIEYGNKLPHLQMFYHFP